MQGWADFSHDMRQFYGVSLACLSDEYRKEQKEYFLQTSAWVDVHPSLMLGPASCFKQYDLAKVSIEDVQAPLQVQPKCLS